MKSRDLAAFKKLAGFMTDSELAKQYGVCRQTIAKYRKVLGIVGKKSGRPKKLKFKIYQKNEK